LLNPGLPNWPRSYEEETDSLTRARIRSCPEDFQVDEELGFTPDGAGEHVLVRIRKRNLNTEQIARQLAHHTGIRTRDIGYCGLKDRNAVTSQWFSVWLPGRPDPDWSSLEDENLQVLKQIRHSRKLQRGALSHNIFTIVLRDVQGDKNKIEIRLEMIKQQGTPNYFGEQRFGRDGNNLATAETMFEGKRIKDRHLRSLCLSAARSFLFNEVLAARVRAGNWQTILPGEAVMLAGSRSFFVCDTVDQSIKDRLDQGDIHPSGPLWGRGELPARAEAANIEHQALNRYELFRSGLEQAGMKQERRALRLLVNDLNWNWLTDEVEVKNLQLHFTLPAGAYATAVLREVCLYQ
jgi:tRNA pseudouridine13 synthase